MYLRRNIIISVCPSKNDIFLESNAFKTFITYPWLQLLDNIGLRTFGSDSMRKFRSSYAFNSVTPKHDMPYSRSASLLTWSSWTSGLMRTPGLRSLPSLATSSLDRSLFDSVISWCRRRWIRWILTKANKINTISVQW